ncbi:hypothetical protein CF64_35290 [Bradyrhizobium japonicum]|nr:hypothetical protein CF64_35290 [Bradyrhizobium japonicum]
MLGAFKTAEVSFLTAMVTLLRKFASTRPLHERATQPAFAFRIAQPYEPAAGRRLSSKSKNARG